MNRKTSRTAKDMLAQLSVDSDGPAGLVSSPFGALNELVRKNASTVMDPKHCDELVSRLLASGKVTIGIKDAVTLLSVADLAGLAVHPFFIRAAARKGVSFYIAEDGSLNRQTHTASADIVPIPLSSEPDPDFYIEPEWFNYLSAFVGSGHPVLLIGPPGCGKTEAVERLFVQREQILQIVPCTPSMTADDFEGVINIADGKTYFTPAPPAVAVAEGHGLLLDEVDAAQAEACYSLYRALDGKDMRIARQGYKGRITPNPNFRVVGTQNTEGRGDDRGIHHGRSFQDEAFLDRWHNFIRVDYLPFDTEVLVLCRRTGLSKKKAKMVVKTATELRRAFATDRIMLCTTMRRTLSVAANIAAGLTPAVAWRFAVQGRATSEDRQIIDDFVNRVYGSSAGKH